MEPSDGAELAKGAHQSAVSSGIPIGQVPDIPEGQAFTQEWKAFKREVHRLVKEGHAGRFALLQEDRLVSVWDTLNDAEQAGRLQFGAAPFLVQEIQLHVKPMRWGYSRPWPA